MKQNYTKMGLIDRSALTFKSYLNGDFGNRFYTDQFLSGVCQTRSDIYANLGKSVLALMVSTLALAYFDLIPPKLNIYDNEIAVSRAFVPIINIVVAISFFTTITKFLDGLAIDRYINTIGNNIDIFSFNLFLIDKNPVNLWIDPLIPRYFGVKSGNMHKISLPVMLIFMILIYVFFMILITCIVSITSTNTFTDKNSTFVTKLISIIPILFLLLSWLLVIAFSIKYKFYDADFDEYNLHPTEQFKAKLEREMVSTSHQEPKPEAPPAHDAH